MRKTITKKSRARLITMKRKGETKSGILWLELLCTECKPSCCNKREIRRNMDKWLKVR
jgi:hypothetical protein